MRRRRARLCLYTCSLFWAGLSHCLFNLMGWVKPNLSWLSCSVHGMERLSKVVLSFLQMFAAVKDLKNLHLMGMRNHHLWLELSVNCPHCTCLHLKAHAVFPVISVWFWEPYGRLSDFCAKQ